MPQKQAKPLERPKSPEKNSLVATSSSSSEERDLFKISSTRDSSSPKGYEVGGSSGGGGAGSPTGEGKLFSFKDYSEKMKNASPEEFFKNLQDPSSAYSGEESASGESKLSKQVYDSPKSDTHSNPDELSHNVESSESSSIKQGKRKTNEEDFPDRGEVKRMSLDASENMFSNIEQISTTDIQTGISHVPPEQSSISQYSSFFHEILHSTVEQEIVQQTESSEIRTTLDTIQGLTREADQLLTWDINTRLQNKIDAWRTAYSDRARTYHAAPGVNVYTDISIAKRSIIEYKGHIAELRQTQGRLNEIIEQLPSISSSTDLLVSTRLKSGEISAAIQARGGELSTYQRQLSQFNQEKGRVYPFFERRQMEWLDPTTIEFVRDGRLPGPEEATMVIALLKAQNLGVPDENRIDVPDENYIAEKLGSNPYGHGVPPDQVLATLSELGKEYQVQPIAGAQELAIALSKGPITATLSNQSDTTILHPRFTYWRPVILERAEPTGGTPSHVVIHDGSRARPYKVSIDAFNSRRVGRFMLPKEASEALEKHRAIQQQQVNNTGNADNQDQ